jgi:predicted DNA binding CopG/RHH family protein
MKKGSTAKKLKEVPIFQNEDEEREFWAHQDSTEFLDWDIAEVTTLPNLKPTTRSISIRISESMLNQIRLIANKRDVPYQSLIKMFLKDRINEELKSS